MWKHFNRASEWERKWQINRSYDGQLSWVELNCVLVGCAAWAKILSLFDAINVRWLDWRKWPQIWSATSNPTMINSYPYFFFFFFLFSMVYCWFCCWFDTLWCVAWRVILIESQRERYNRQSYNILYINWERKRERGWIAWARVRARTNNQTNKREGRKEGRHEWTKTEKESVRWRMYFYLLHDMVIIFQRLHVIFYRADIWFVGFVGFYVITLILRRYFVCSNIHIRRRCKWNAQAKTNKSDNISSNSRKKQTFEPPDHPKESEHNANQAKQIVFLVY